ncbi:hypothetical protein [Novosphingobium sp.]|uniref:hypothetical protein n=1 Tax=Novosphingobium sp. TaxID=1874826 RepID=UPI0018265A4F|nr:hypothetical protein [Novosphingobium sp.]
MYSSPQGPDRCARGSVISEVRFACGLGDAMKGAAASAWNYSFRVFRWNLRFTHPAFFPRCLGFPKTMKRWLPARTGALDKSEVGFGNMPLKTGGNSHFIRRH